MTGESIPTKENWRRLTPYYKNLTSGVLIVGGSFLMIEHLHKFGGFDLLDFVGHEYYGFGMILLALFLSMKWHQWESMGLKDPRRWFR